MAKHENNTALCSSSQFSRKVSEYRTRYLLKSKHINNEAATKIVVNHLLTDVFGYEELTEVKLEYPVLGGRADYMIELADRRLALVEVKRLGQKLTSKAIRQALSYSILLDIEWVILTDSRQLLLYKINFERPPSVTIYMKIDILNTSSKDISLLNKLTKRSLVHGSFNVRPKDWLPKS